MRCFFDLETTGTDREKDRRPIQFSPPMVRAILSGQKSQTRRLMTPQPVYRENATIPGEMGTFFHHWNLDVLNTTDSIMAHCPFGGIGDQLWVREPWRKSAAGILYRADYGDHSVARWKPGMFLEREDARIVLEVTGIRVQKLQTITEADAKEEGYLYFWNREPRPDSNPRWWFAEVWNSLHAKKGRGWLTNPWVWVVSFRKLLP